MMVIMAVLLSLRVLRMASSHMQRGGFCHTAAQSHAPQHEQTRGRQQVPRVVPDRCEAPATQLPKRGAGPEARNRSAAGAVARRASRGQKDSKKGWEAQSAGKPRSKQI